jgi:hypothetical protein
MTIVWHEVERKINHNKGEDIDKEVKRRRANNGPLVGNRGYHHNTKAWI